ncbi:MAG TPA: nuclear transport factor 2 family protein [Acidimicrobiales bacterium]|nr:nuclear transport factor 2 family protein [Acidimicrobiales bacterium]
MTAIEQYLDALDKQDWDRLATTLAEEGVVRDGPFVDVVKGKQPYVDFLAGVVPTLPNYSLTVHKLNDLGERRWFAEVSETFDVQGTRTSYPEILEFRTDNDGQINYVSVFMKFPGMQPPVEGGSAAG